MQQPESNNHRQEPLDLQWDEAYSELDYSVVHGWEYAFKEQVTDEYVQEVEKNEERLSELASNGASIIIVGALGLVLINAIRRR